MKSVLITGGAGFLGSHLAKRVKTLGYKVILVDLPHKFSDFHEKEYKTIECDISDRQQVKRLLPPAEVVYHLAGHVGTASSLKDPSRDLLDNACGTLNIIEYCKESKVEKIVFSSSMAVYGRIRKAEEVDTKRPISPYGISKSCAEEYVRHLSQRHPEVQCVTFRIFNCYGPGQKTKGRTQGLASIFLEQIYSGELVEVTGDLERERDLIYLEDAINALVLPLNNSSMRGFYNLCSGESTKIGELIEKIIHISGKKRDDVKVVDIGGIAEDPACATGSNRKLRQLGWTPLTSLDEGLKHCWELKFE